MKQPTKPNDSTISLEDIGFNESPNEHFSTVLNSRMSRRNLLRSGAVFAAGSMLSSIGLAGCGGSANASDVPAEKLLGFSAVGKSLVTIQRKKTQ